MIIKPPKTEYEKKIYNILITREDFLITRKGINRETKKQEMIPVWSEADKSIVYDFCVQYIPRYIRVHWDTLDIENYVNVIKNTYEHTKHSPMLNVISSCINNLNLGYKAKVEDKTIVII